MDDQLQLLIQHFEKESADLEAAIASYLLERDYEMAEYNYQALISVSYQLRILRTFEDPLYSQKTELRRSIERGEAFMQKPEPDPGERVWIYKLAEQKIELQKLEKESAVLKDKPDENLLRRTLRDLMTGRIQKFRLVMNRFYRFELHFKYSRRVLIVQIPEVKRLIDEYVLDDEDYFRSIAVTGFVRVRSRNRLELRLKGATELVEDRLMTTLAILFFDKLKHVEWLRNNYIIIEKG